MKKLIIIILLFAPIFSRAQNADYTLTIKLNALKTPAKAYLIYNFGWTNQRSLDSAESNNGTFIFEREAGDTLKTQIVIEHTGQHLKSFDRKADMLFVFLDNNNITINGKDSIKNATISGSKLNEEYIKYHTMVLLPGENKINALNAKYAAATNDKRNAKEFKDSLMTEYREMVKEQDSLTKNYINKNPDSYFSLMALSEMANGNSDKAIGNEPAFKALSTRLKTSKDGVNLARLIEAGRITSVGTIAPDFVENDVNDKPVKLSDYKGKYVLLDFWASWCGPCRAENPNVLKAYNKYKDKNFTVLGVSLDAKKEPWLAAIKTDGLTWTEISDLKGWNNMVAKQYTIRSIPQNFLIDPTGKIVGKNLRGDDLEAKLASLLN
jgi:peroxiredoxin